MLARFGAVVALVLSAVWLAREPSWEPLAAVAATFLTYLGIEVVVYRNARRDDENRKYVPDPRWPGTATHKEFGDRVCYACLSTKHAALPLIRDPDNNRWGCAGCHTQLNPLEKT